MNQGNVNQGTINFTQLTSTMFRAMELPFIMAAALLDGIACSTNTMNTGQTRATGQQWSACGDRHRNRRSRQRARARARRRTGKNDNPGFQRAA
jgi:hypothetical protein